MGNARHSICFITEADCFGGAEVHTLSIIKLLLSHDFYVELVQCKHNGYQEIVKSLSSSKIKLINTDLSVNERNPKLIADWGYLLRSLNSYVLILPKGWNGMGSVEFLKTCKKVFRKVYFIEHSEPDPMPPKTSTSHFSGLVKGLGLWWYKEKYERRKRSFYADKIIAVSNAAARMLIEECWYPAKKVTVITNGVYSDKFRRNNELGCCFRTRYSISYNDFVFGMVSRMDKLKALDIAINSFQRVLKEHPNRSIVLIICGIGSEENSLRKLVSELNVANKVIFTGFIDKPQEAFSAIDCILFPSRKEGLPLALLEGMAAGCVPIVTKVGGMPEVVNESSLGWVVNLDDSNAFCKAMNEVISLDKVELEAMREHVVNCVEQNYSAEKSYEKIMNTIGVV